MKIGLALDTTLDSDAGVQQFIKGLARYLLSKGHEVRFFVPRSIVSPEFKGMVYSFGRNINPPLIKPTNVSFGLYFGNSRLKQILAQEKLDILHVAAPYSPFLSGKIIKFVNCPIVSSYMIYSESWLHRLGGIILRFINHKSYKKIDSFIASSNAAQHDAEITLPGKYKIIPLGVNLIRFSPKIKPLDKFNDGKLNILYLNRLEKRKGAEYLIRAFSIVKAKMKNTRLILISDGHLRKRLEKLVSDLKLDDVVFAGYIDEKIKPRYYASAHLCVFPSIFGECFGTVLIESMASGKVTIAYANEGYSFVLKNLPELLVENKNIPALADKIIKFLKNTKLRREYEKKCLVESKSFSWEVVGARILEEYKNLLKDR